VPSNFHSENDAGHAVETLLCGASGKDCSFYASSSVRIGPYQVLITSEIDARDDAGRVIELKSSSNKEGMAFVDNHVSLQVACNGSHHVLGCTLDVDKTKLLKTEAILASDAIQSHSNAFINQGQRVVLLLERVYNHECFDRAASASDTSVVMEVTFDDIKAPIIKPTPSGIGVLPEGRL